ETENIYTKLKSQEGKATVVFMGHWDSKSQTFPSSLRIILIILAVFGALILVIIYLILSIIRIFIPFEIYLLNLILFSSSIVIAIIGSLNFFNKTGNQSPGAYDNASAVGVVIELARYFKNNPLNNIDFIFLAPSSEELNLGGIKDFLKKHKEEFDIDTTYFINYDLIGGNIIKLIYSFGIPRKVSSHKLNKLFLNSAKELNLKIKDQYLPTGAWSDYMPVVYEGFEACWLATLPGLKMVHTKNDNMELITNKGLKDILELTIKVIEKLNSEYN
ncbi:MAG: M28 family peptidase, partial [Promethearchaeota archaeon]